MTQVSDSTKGSTGDTADEIKGLATQLKGDLTQLAPKAGGAISYWESLLAGLGPTVKPIHTDLGQLKEHLTGGKPDGAAIAKLLNSLSTKTATVADAQTGPIATALKSLASALESGAASLTAK